MFGNLMKRKLRPTQYKYMETDEPTEEDDPIVFDLNPLQEAMKNNFITRRRKYTSVREIPGCSHQ